jgi:ABC-type oligopeptide transport system ATPase subunit
MILNVIRISKYFPIEQGIFRREAGMLKALDEVSFSVAEFTTLGIVGESGSGKTTLAKIILDLIPATTGEIFFSEDFIRNFRKDTQIIFQNPYNSLNPKMRIFDIICEPMIIHKIVDRKHIRDKVVNLLETVGLSGDILTRYPHEFSGGQRQRICIARALASEPKFIVLDEPISSLDLTVQAKLLDLFIELKQKFNLTYIFISHNLGVIKYISDAVIVMQNGRIIERGKVGDIFNQPSEQYTKKLLEAAR